ncbi:MAG: hypothetical protein NTY31_03365 [Candidatus Falkowbacteria bacterium]|nr:hypothetical protein [Candidatus Falkowbacteria bacterium]
MKKVGLTLLFSLLLFIPFLCPAEAALINANKTQEYNNNINALANQTDYDTSVTLENRISTIIRIALSVLGAIFLVLMFWTGNNWMQAAGNEEKVKKAKTAVRNLLIGVVLILIAYALSSGFSGLLVRNLLTK